MTTFLIITNLLLICKVLWPSKKVKAKVKRAFGEIEIMEIDPLYKVNDTFNNGYYDYVILEIASPGKTFKEKLWAFIDFIAEAKTRLKKIA